MLASSEAALPLADRSLSPFELTEIATLHTRLAVASAGETAHSELTGLAEEAHSIAIGRHRTASSGSTRWRGQRSSCAPRFLFRDLIS
jgi:hypothetical protein